MSIDRGCRLGRMPASRGTARVIGIGVGLVLAVLAGGAAFAFWTATGAGSASASSGTLAEPTGVTASASGSTVTIGFTGVTPPGGVLDGYYVTRYLGATPSNACGTNPAVPSSLLPAAATGCTDTLVPNGTYTYTVTAVFRTWTATSTPSPSVTVTSETVPPTQVLTVNSAGDTYRSGSTLYYRSTVAGSFTIDSAVTDTGSGPASATFPAVPAAGWNHPAETVTSGTGVNPTKTYTSSTYTWAAGATSPGAHTVTAADVVGNTSGSTLTITGDGTGPTGGSLVVGGVAATPSGDFTQQNRFAGWTGTRTDFSADSGSGLASSVLTREFAPGTTCSGYGAPTVVTGSINESPVLANGCYRYTLTGTDNVGNTSVLVLVVTTFNDNTDPTQTFSATGNGAVTGTTLYYRSAVAGSFTITSAVTDFESGPNRAEFPAVTGGGWTHAFDSITTGVGSHPTIAYTSTSYSWTANPNNPSNNERRISAYDNEGNRDRTRLTFTPDDVAPTGGALTVNDQNASPGGTTSTSMTGTFTGSRTAFADADSGMGTDILTREVATLSGGGVCGTYGAPTVVVGAPNESSLPQGCYRYTLTGTDRVGNASSLTTVVRVVNGTLSQVVSLSGGAGEAVLNGSTIYYNPANAGSFTLNNALTGTGLDPASTEFPAIATAGWTHTNETVTTGSGALPTLTYASSAFSWTASPSVPAAYTVTGANTGGATVGTALTVTPDVTGPTGGALTVDGVAGTSGGATGYSSTGTYTGSYSDFTTDAGAGYQATSVSRAYASSLANGVCGAFGPSALIGSISESNAAAGCYRYTLTGTDVFGNASSLVVVMQVDKTAPSITLTGGGTNGHVSGGTVFYKGTTAGTLTLTASVTDGQSGPGQAGFPVMTTAGWTHAAELVGSGTGSIPTIAYTSSTYSWIASPSNPGPVADRTITGYDQAGNTVTTVPTFTSDTTSPTGGALTVNGTAATGGGSTSNTNATSWTIGARTDFNADTGSGFASSVLTREAAPWSGSTCGTFGAPVTITGAPAQTGMAGGTCYRYVLTGTDNVGNVSTLTTTVRTGIVVSSVTLNNGGAGSTPGTLNRGDTIVVKYSGPIAVSSLCSTWSGDTTNQSITANGVVGVTIREGAGSANDYVQVSTTGAACGGDFNFGTLTLGDDGYLVSTTIQTFRGSGGTNVSTIAYDASTYTLTITLGINETTPGVDGSNNVNGNTVAVYAPDAAITGIGGVGITGTGATANVRQF